MAKKMTDEELATYVEAQARNSSGHWDTKLSTERTLVQRYYDGLEPRQTNPGGSKYFSNDVFESVEAMKAQLLETFGGTAKPVSFAPQGENDVALARDATEYVNYAVMRQNPGYAIMRDAIDDGLKCRVGLVKVWWDKSEEEVEEEVNDIPYEELLSILATKPDAELDDLELDQDTQLVKHATIITKRNTSQVRIENLPPEEFGITKMSKSLGDAPMCFHRGRKTAAKLVEMGISKKLVDELKADDRLWAARDTETLTRFEEVGEDNVQDRAHDEGDTAREIEVIEAYAKLDLDGRPKLWCIMTAGGKFLSKSVIKRVPIIAFTPLPRPHSFWGSSYAKKVIPFQNAQTMLKRGIMDHMAITNTPRYTVLKGSVVNPRELTEPRLGGIVNITREGGIQPLPQYGLNPFVFQTIGLLDDSKEGTTGISKLSQGLNKDAVSKQNSADMVSQMVGLSQVRQKIVARNFADNFLKPLYLEVYRLVVENEAPEAIIQVAGAWTPVDPSGWTDRKDVIAEVNVGFGEREKEQQKWLAIDTYLASQPNLAPVYDSQRRFYVMKRILDAMGVKDVNSIIADPATVNPPAPDPLQEAEIAVKTAQADAAKAQAQATLQKLQLEAHRFQLEHEVAVAELNVKMAEIKGKLWVQQQEVQLAREAQVSGELKAVAAPDA